MCVVMVTDKNSASSGFKANYESVAHDVDQKLTTNSKRKSNKRSQLETELDQVLPPSTGENFWVIGG